MMEEMNSLDIYYVLKELKSLQGGKIDKIYQRDKKFRIQVYRKGKTYDLILEPGKIYVSNYRRKGPKEPSNFCMFLRKHMRNKALREIGQHKFDRIVEIRTEGSNLVCEIFGKGNFVLVDKDGTIIQPLEVQKWSQRKVAPKNKYKYPPPGKDPREMGSREFGRFVKTDSEVVRKMARDLNLGGRWAEEACLRADVEKSKTGENLEDKEITRLRKAVKSLFDEEIQAKIIKEDGKPIAAVPFEMQRFEGHESEVYDSFNRALDEFFSRKEVEEVEEEKEKKKEEEISKIERIKKEQEEAEEKWEDTRADSEKKAELIYQNYTLVEDVLSGIQKAMNSGISWNEIKERIDEEDTSQARAVKEIRENEGVVVVEIEDEEVELDFRKSVEENAESFYESKKKATEKLEKIKEEKEKVEEKVEGLKQKEKEEFSGEEEERRKPEREVKVSEEEGWYKKYRWFRTSEDFLVVAGESANQNEKLVKKQAEEEDIILHAEIQGSPFTLIKTGDREVTPLAIREAAEFCASFSNAWKRNMGAVDVYWVRPEQVSKDTPSGEYVGKGSFMVKGRKNYLKKTELKVSIGVKLDREENEIRVLNGSTQSVRENSDYFVSLNPGETEREELASKIKSKLAEKAAPEDKRYVKKIPLNKIKPLIPSGGGILVE